MEAVTARNMKHKELYTLYTNDVSRDSNPEPVFSIPGFGGISNPGIPAELWDPGGMRSKTVIIEYIGQGRSDGGIWVFIPPKKSAQVNFLWGKNDVLKITSEWLFNSFIPKPLYPKTNIWLRP